jgi:hypothetical protein
LLKEYNKLWVFGDSYTTANYCVDVKDSFWGLTAKHLNAKNIVNCSWPGNSFGSIKHMLISMQLQFNFANDFFIIGIPPLERLTVFDNFKDTKYYATCIDTTKWQSQQQQIDCHTGLQILKVADTQHMVVYQDRSWAETQELASIFLITSWLDQVNANYLLVNLSKPFDTNNVWGPSGFVLPYCRDHNKCILFDNTYYSVNLDKYKPADFKQYGWMGHHGPEGNQHFFEISIKDKLC